MAKVSAEVGSTANRYQILGRLAVGGMAEIFLARSANATGLERYCVLKRILKERAGDAQFVQMFLDEARLAAQLQHPNIASVYDLGMLGDSYFFTMEYVHGETVRSLIHRALGMRRPVPLACVLTIIAGAAAGLHHAHDRVSNDGRPLGIVHRDVSPSNLMVSYEGNVKIVDFGVAKAANRAVETQSGTVKGKISYLSPEQCRGVRVDRRSDLFSLGIVMWELLTGARLYRRDSDFEILTAIVKEPPRPPSQRRADLPRAIDDIVLRLLAKSMTDRFQTAGEVVEAIEHASMRAGTILSPSAVSRLIHDLFGARAEPWLEFSADTLSLGHSVLASRPLPERIGQVASDPAEAELAAVPDLSASLVEDEFDSSEDIDTFDPEAQSPHHEPAPTVPLRAQNAPAVLPSSPAVAPPSPAVARSAAAQAPAPTAAPPPSPSAAPSALRTGVPLTAPSPSPSPSPPSPLASPPSRSAHANGPLPRPPAEPEVPAMRSPDATSLPAPPRAAIHPSTLFEALATLPRSPAAAPSAPTLRGMSAPSSTAAVTTIRAMGPLVTGGPGSPPVAAQPSAAISRPAAAISPDAAFLPTLIAPPVPAALAAPQRPTWQPAKATPSAAFQALPPAGVVPSSRSANAAASPSPSPFSASPPAPSLPAWVASPPSAPSPYVAPGLAGKPSPSSSSSLATTKPRFTGRFTARVTPRLLVVIVVAMMSGSFLAWLSVPGEHRVSLEVRSGPAAGSAGGTVESEAIPDAAVAHTLPPATPQPADPVNDASAGVPADPAGGNTAPSPDSADGDSRPPGGSTHGSGNAVTPVDASIATPDPESAQGNGSGSSSPPRAAPNPPPRRPPPGDPKSTPEPAPPRSAPASPTTPGAAGPSGKDLPARIKTMYEQKDYVGVLRACRDAGSWVDIALHCFRAACRQSNRDEANRWLPRTPAEKQQQLHDECKQCCNIDARTPALCEKNPLACR